MTYRPTTARLRSLILAASGTSDVVDAHLAVLAKRLKLAVWTTDPDDLAALGVTAVSR